MEFPSPQEPRQLLVGETALSTAAPSTSLDECLKNITIKSLQRDVLTHFTPYRLITRPFLQVLQNKIQIIFHIPLEENKMETFTV